jgi:AraC-like DNA-binding protein
MKYAHPQWRGFERAPEGHLLDQLVDLARPMGIAYERSVGFHKDFHAHDRPMIVLPRGSCVVKVKTTGARAAYEIDSSSLLIVPNGVEHDDEGLTSIFDTVALYPSASLQSQVAEDEAITASQMRTVFGRCQKLPRSRWLEQLLQEYFFARVVSRRESARTLAFFERQMLVELLASALGGRTAIERGRAIPSSENVTDRALRYIESNLFSKMPLEAIARQAFASASTLLRRFRQDTGKSPHGYVKTRRLEEARRMIETGPHPVGHVAMLVGYENFGAFSTAFKKQFGRPPSSFQPRRGPLRGAESTLALGSGSPSPRARGPLTPRGARRGGARR